MKSGCNGQLESQRRQIGQELFRWIEAKEFLHSDQDKPELEKAYHAGFRGALEQLGWKLSEFGMIKPKGRAS